MAMSSGAKSGALKNEGIFDLELVVMFVKSEESTEMEGSASEVDDASGVVTVMNDWYVSTESTFQSLRMTEWSKELSATGMKEDAKEKFEMLTAIAVNDPSVIVKRERERSADARLLKVTVFTARTEVERRSEETLPLATAVSTAKVM